MMNRLHNCRNPAQGDFKRVLAVCSAGLLRSPTIAYVLSQPPYNFNTRACGLHDYALIPLDKVLLRWAQEIVCVQDDHEKLIKDAFEEHNMTPVPIINLDIEDMYRYRSPKLIALIKERYPLPEGA
jgi:predicted protein tyrosine phosphatase